MKYRAKIQFAEVGEKNKYLGTKKCDKLILILNILKPSFLIFDASTLINNKFNCNAEKGLWGGRKVGEVEKVMP